MQLPVHRPVRRPGRALAAAAATVLLLGLARLLPEGGAGLALRLTAASVLVLILPGALVLRIVGRPAQLGPAAAASLAWSLVVVGVGFAVVFATGSSIGGAALVLGVIVCVALVAPCRPAPALERRDLVALLAVVGAGVVLAGVVWWSTGTIGGSVGPTDGDALFHLARVRKLVELPSLHLASVDEFRDGGLHPGYAFPLWHGAVALISWLAGVDATPAFLFLPAVLTPLVLVVAYGAGQALFGTWSGGVATAAAQAALVVFSRAGVGALQFLAQPGAVARLLLVPALLGLVFAFTTSGARALLASIAAGALVLTLVHPTYLVYVVMLVFTFAAAYLLLDRDDRRGAKRIGAALAAVLVPAGLALVWLAPIIRQAAAFSPSQAETRRALGRYAAEVVVSGSRYAPSPRYLAWGGAATVAGLVAVPLAGLAARRAWAAYVLGGTVVLGAIAVVPALFTHFADALSLSQALRIGGFLPLPFALAGVAELAAGAGWAAPLLALGAGTAAVVAYPDAATGAGWAVWIAVGGGLAALLLAAFGVLPRLAPRSPLTAALMAIAFIVPFASDAFAHLRRYDTPDPFALTPGLVKTLDTSVRHDQVVLSNVETSYRISADAPVYVAASLPGHVARTAANRPYERQWDVVRFFFRANVTNAERWAILRRFKVNWIVVDTHQRSTPFVDRFRRTYADSRYRLYRVPPPRPG